MKLVEADRDLSNEICSACYKWVKGDGPEPYSPAVASLTVMVHDLADRAFDVGAKALASELRRLCPGDTLLKTLLTELGYPT
jgi:hypothetical protein